MEQIGEKSQNAIKFAISLCEVIEDDKIIGVTPNDKIIKFLGFIIFFCNYHYYYY
jgi:hypothetical protein